jgi:4-hydroxy-tetrahydrodipicolinate reductase
MKQIKVAINGANGRMGQAVQEVLNNDNECVFERGLDRYDTRFRWKHNTADVIIDFSSNDGLSRLLDELEKAKELNQIPKLISGTTGLSDETFKKLRQYGNRAGVIWGSNTSFGVNLMFAMVKKLGAVLHGNEYDAEVYERHHRMKKDAPSGTALTIGKKIAEGRGVEFIKNDYSSFGERKTGEIGFAVERAGKTVGFHEARFISDDETIWFGHEAHDRSIFAKGAVKLAKIAVERDIKGYKEAWELLTDFI